MKKKILVVDDEAGLLKAILLRLNKEGYETFGGVNGQEALDLARQREPDLIILDVVLPKMNGDEVAKILKKEERLKRIPIFLMSAVTGTLEEKTRDCGAANYFFKPLEMDKLLSGVEKYLPLTRIDPSTKTILVIDDDAADRNAIVTSMKKEGYVVTEASHVDEAMLKIRQTLPDIVIVDVVTQDSNTTGFDICKKIKSTFQPNPPAVLIVTGQAAGVNNALADKVGGIGIEVKTRDARFIIKAVRKVLADKTVAAAPEEKASGMGQAVKVVQNIFSRNGS